MSDTAASSPSAPASTPAGAESVIPDAAANLAAHGKAQPAAKPEAAADAGQPRGPDGKFQPKEPAAPPPPPRRWKLGEREVEDPEELYSLAAQKEVERSAYEAALAKARKAEEYEAKLAKDPKALFSDEAKRREFALSIIREEMEREAEKALPPEQRELLQAKRELERIKQERAEEQERQHAARLEAATQAARQELVTSIREAMDASGLPQSDALARRVATLMKAAHAKGLNYPPAVIARQVREEWTRDSAEAFGKMKPAELVKALPFLLEKLNEVDDPAVLKSLGKLGERLRRLNLEALGAAPAASAQPAAVVPSGAPGYPHLQKPKGEWTPADWDAEFERRARE